MLESQIEELYRQEDTYWWHVGKRAALVQVIKKYLPPGAGRRALEIGPGAGRMLMELSGMYDEAWGVELSRPAIECCARRGLDKVVEGNAEKELPFEDGHFGLVVCADALEHMDDDAAALAQIARVLEPGGGVAITVPAYPGMYSYWDEAHGHKRRYTRAELEKKVRGAGLRPVKLSHTNAFILPPAVLVRKLKGAAGGAPEESSSDFFEVPAPVNSIMISLYTVERAILKYMNIPFGLSIICVAVKE